MTQDDSINAESHLTLENRIRARAHEIWLSRKEGREEDRPLDDWLQAEREVLGEDPHQPAQDRGTIVGPAHRPDIIEQ
jgi:hypothetical protein